MGTTRGRARRGLGVAAGVILLALAQSAPVFAQASGGEKPWGATTDAVFRLYEDGIAAKKAGDWQKAYELLWGAWRLKEHYQIAANLGEAALRVGKAREAAEHLAYFMREAKNVAPDDRARAQQMLNEAKQKVGTLLIKTNRPAADVLLDGKVVGQAGVMEELYVEPGSHTVEARLGGERAAPVTVEMAAGGARQVGLMFGRGEVAEAPEGPAQGTQAPTEQAGPRTAVLIAGGAAAGAALVAGVILTAVANGNAGARDDLLGWEGCYGGGTAPGLPDCAKADDLRRGAASFGNAAFWSFVGSGAIGTATVVYALISPRGEERARRVQVVPVVGVGGLGMRGSF